MSVSNTFPFLSKFAVFKLIIQYSLHERLIAKINERQRKDIKMEIISLFLGYSKTFMSFVKSQARMIEGRIKGDCCTFQEIIGST